MEENVMADPETKVDIKPVPPAESLAAKGTVSIETKATFNLDEKMLQCLNGQGLTVTSITVT